MEKITLKNLLALTAGLTIVAPTTVGILTNVAAVPKAITNQELVNEINHIPYQTIIHFNSGLTAKELAQTITPEFMQAQLQDSFKNVFNSDLFALTNITVRHRALDNNDLYGIGIIDAQINYHYGAITNQTTNLTIEKIIAPDEIVAEINSQKYSKEIIMNQTNSVANFIKSITVGFIQEPLSADVKNGFKNDWFRISKITIAGKPLTDNDLRKVHTLNAQIIYTYGSAIEQKTTLTIKVSSTSKMQ